MNFLAPGAFLLSLLLPVIVLMYLLKLRRTEQLVSSVYLWRRMVRDIEANAPWQRLRRNLLMILQLLFLAALILALARPFTWAEGASGQAVILIMDTSASMAATDMQPNRLEAAKDQARQVVDGLPDDARITVIAVSDTADVLVSSSRDLRQVYQALESIQIRNGGSNLTSALGLASAIAARQPETQVVIFSDGRVELPERLALKGSVSYMPIGQSGENQAISLLSLQLAPGGETAAAFAQVTNYGSEPAERRLELYGGDRLLNAYDLQIEPGSQQAVIAEGLPAEVEWVTANLVGEDSLPVDDETWAVLQQGELLPVKLVTEGNLFLETGLSLLPGITLTTLRPSDYEASGQEAEESPSASQTAPDSTSLTIFDAYVPITATLPAGNLLFIAPPRSTEFFTVTGKLAQPALRVTNSDHPIAAHLNLDAVNLLDSVQLTLPPWAVEVIAAEAEEGTSPALFAGSSGSRRVGVITFDIRHTDLPLQVAFPLLLSNLTGWFAPEGGSHLPSAVQPGHPVSLPSVGGAGAAEVIRPDGSRVQVDLSGGAGVFGETSQLGLYEVRWSEAGQSTTSRFAVNLFSPSESSIEPAQTLPLTGIEEAGSGPLTQEARREWWRPLGFLALAFLVAEWLLYQRATLVRLWSGLTLARKS